MALRGNRDSLKRKVTGLCVSCLLVLCAGPAFAVEPFEIICDGEATGISADGSVVVGTIRESGETWRWTQESGMVLLGRARGNADEIDLGTPDVSDDGRIVSATVRSAEAGHVLSAHWSETTGWAEAPLGSGAEGGSWSQAHGLSGDGTTLVGQIQRESTSQAATWHRDNGLTTLASPSGNSRANACNRDGSVIVGWCEGTGTGTWQPSVWTGAGLTILAPTKAFCEAAGVSADGNIIVGQSYEESWGQRGAALWLNSDFGWVQESLGTLPGTFSGYGQAMALDLTDDGHTIVGFNSFDGNRSVGFIWTPGDGLIDVHEYLVGHEVAIPEGFRISSVTGISGDGSFMTGFGEDTTFWPPQARSFRICVDAIPRDESRKKIVPAGMDIPNPFLTKDLK